jgi:hypothetical protein
VHVRAFFRFRTSINPDRHARKPYCWQSGTLLWWPCALRGKANSSDARYPSKWVLRPLCLLIAVTEIIQGHISLEALIGYPICWYNLYFPFFPELSLQINRDRGEGEDVYIDAPSLRA